MSIVFGPTLQLHDQIAAVAPIDGCWVGNWDDKATWGCHFQDDATDEQKQAAADVIAAFDPYAYSASQQLSDDDRAILRAAEIVRARHGL